MARWFVLAAVMVSIGCREPVVESSPEAPTIPQPAVGSAVKDANAPPPGTGISARRKAAKDAKAPLPGTRVSSRRKAAKDAQTPLPGTRISSRPKAAEGDSANSGSVPATVRPAALAGSWYEGDASALQEKISGYLANVPENDVAGHPVALLVPHAGHRYSGAIAARAYATLQGRTYSRVYILGPAHKTALKGVAFPRGTTHFETPLGQIPLAMDVVDELLQQPLFVEHPSAHRNEHSIEIQLPFLQTVLPHGFELVPMVVSRLNRAEIDTVSNAIRAVLRPGDLLIASSDFTHYGERFSYLGPPGKEFGPAAAPARLQALLDAAWIEIEKGDGEAFLRHKVESGDTICGFLPIALLLKAMPVAAKPQLLGSDMSGHMTGSFAESVSYLSAVFTGLWPYSGVTGEAGLSSDEKGLLLALARRQVDAYVNRQERLAKESLDVTLTSRLKADCGTFVTLKQGGRLRGCIGNIMPVKPLYQAVLDNAVNAAHFDRRFKPVQPEELARTTVEVSVLTPPVKQQDWRDFVIGRDGIILSKPEGSAVFLPQVAVEQGWTLEETLNHLSRKAGLGLDGWRKGATFQTFEAIVFHEEP